MPKRKSVPVRLGGVYYNTRNEVHVVFVDRTTDVVGYVHFINGERRGRDDATLARLRRLLARGHYRFDHIDLGC